MVFSMVGVAHAAGITRFTLSVANQTVRAEADHTVTFVTPSGVDDPADTIIMTYGAAADLTALSLPRDLDLAVDNDAACDGPFSDQTVAAVASSGAWGCAIAGNNITCTPPIDAGAGTVPADRCIQVQVGTNATYGQAGAAQIQNPISDGELRLSIGGGFGDSGSAVTSIVDSSNVRVLVSVCPEEGSCTPGDGGGSISREDDLPPNIFNVQVVLLSDTSARISWETDEAADQAIEWGNIRFLDRLSQRVSQYGSEHSFDLTGLTPGQSYEATLRSADLSGNEAQYGPVEFTLSDSTAPVILDPQATAITSTSAVIQWLTDESSDSSVEYGTTSSYGLLTEDGEFVTDHAVLLTGLSPGTTYHFRVTSMDGEGNTATSGDVVFTTDIDLAPLNVTLEVTSGDTLNVLEWTLPDDADLAGVRMVYRTDRFPSDPYDGYLIYNTLGTVFYHEGLTNGQIYYYGLFAYDVAGNIASGTLGYGTPYGSSTGGGSLTKEQEPGDEGGSGGGGGGGGGTLTKVEEPDTGTTSSTNIPPESTTLPPIYQTPDSAPTSTPSNTQPSTPTDVVQSTPESTLGIYVAGGAIALEPGSDGAYHVLSGRPFTLGVDAGGAEVTGILAQWKGGVYNVSRITRGTVGSLSGLTEPAVTTVYGHVATLEGSDIGSTLPLDVVITYADGVSHIKHLLVYIEPLGRVVEQQEDTLHELVGPMVTLYQRERLLWSQVDTTRSVQDNPTVSDSYGFGWYVPNGVYDVRVNWDGFLEARTGAMTVTDHLVHPTVVLTRVPLSVIDVVKIDLPPAEKAVQVIWASLDQAKAQYRLLRESAAVELVTPPVQLSLGASLLLSALFLSALMQSTIRRGRLLLSKVEGHICRPILCGDTDPFGRAEFVLPGAGTYVVSLEVAEEAHEKKHQRLPSSEDDVEVSNGSWVVVEKAEARRVRLAPGLLYALQPHKTKRSIDLVHRTAKLSVILASFLFALVPGVLSVVLLAAACTFAFAEHHWLHQRLLLRQ